MTQTTIQTAFNAGEISPSLYGHVDLAKYHFGCSTMRNFFANFRGGAASRAGHAYVGMTKQQYPAAPPRDIPFQYNITQGFVLEFGDNYMRVKSQGAYVVESSKPITGATNANPAVITIVGHGYSAGDWVFISGMGGMTSFNGLTWIVNTVPDANHITLIDLFGSTINSISWSAYTSGGTIARLYTLATPYAAVDLPYLKYTQSANSMTLTCVNLPTRKEYPPYDLVRVSATNWTLTQTAFSSNITKPLNLIGTPHNSATADTWYSYVVTAVNANGEESTRSNRAPVLNNNISIYAGSNELNWTAVNGASSYNVYKATPSYSVPINVGVLYGYVGSSIGPTFSDTNITADFSIVPPVHRNPFARSPITDVVITANGANYTQATVGFSVTTSTGSGFSGTPIVVGGKVVGFQIDNEGANYALTDIITIIDSAIGAGATATLSIGPATGTYPGVPTYFQQRRGYADSLNEPDTYWFSKPGSYTNMDSSIPVNDEDAITGSPWAQQVNGIQFMVPMPGGLVVLTGNGAWQLSGSGQNNSAITPSDQNAVAQAYNGCSDVVPPLVINADILYVQSKGSIVRDLAYNFFANIYTGTDKTVLSNHLFDNKTILQWAYAEEPYKLVWAVRNDGVMLSMSYLKEQDVYGWARHDTNGLFLGVCSITELPVDAVYVITQRYVQGAWRYYSERMDNRTWQTVEAAWCVDCGLAYPMTYPAATIIPSAVTGDVTFNATAAVFSTANIGDVIRVGGGIATITTYIGPSVVIGTITQDITATVPNDPGLQPIPQIAGNWSVSTPTTTVSGLNHLIGKTVAILGDGSVFPNQIVSDLGGGKIGITLPNPCSQITIGLPFVAQVQLLYLDPPTQQVTVQTKRKDIYSVGARFEASRGMQFGTNQPDAATQPNGATVPWTNMKEVKERGPTVHAGDAIPLFTGDYFELVPGDWNVKGQVAVQQMYPLPCNLLMVVPYYENGDTAG